MCFEGRELFALSDVSQLFPSIESVFVPRKGMLRTSKFTRIGSGSSYWMFSGAFVWNLSIRVEALLLQKEIILNRTNTITGPYKLDQTCSEMWNVFPTDDHNRTLTFWGRAFGLTAETGLSLPCNKITTLGDGASSCSIS